MLLLGLRTFFSNERLIFDLIDALRADQSVKQVRAATPRPARDDQVTGGTHAERSPLCLSSSSRGNIEAIIIVSIALAVVIRVVHTHLHTPRQKVEAALRSAGAHPLLPQKEVAAEKEPPDAGL